MAALIAGGTLVVAWALTRVVLRFAVSRGMIDVPNDRSSHAEPTPRGGGVAILVSTLGALLLGWALGFIAERVLWGVGGGMAAVGVVGWLDDRRGLSAAIRFGVHVAAAGWALHWLGGLPLLDFGGHSAVRTGLLGWPLGILGLVWMTNLYNFMDGIDGLAAGQAIAVGSIGGGLLYLSGQPGLALLPLTLAAAAAGFLAWNRPPARIFMGDVGSGALGFGFGAIAVASENAGAVPLVLWVLLLGVFVFDATVTLGRRVLQRDRWYAPHRSHAYQRAVQGGLGHGAVSAAACLLTVVLGALAAVATVRPSFVPGAVAIGVLLLAVVYRRVERLSPMNAPSGRRRDVPVALFVVNATWFFVAQRMAPAIALRRAGFDVHVASAPDAEVAKLLENGFHHHPLRLARRGVNPLQELHSFFQLVRLYRALNPDLVHHITIKPVVYGGIASRLAGVPGVVNSISGMGYVALAPGGSGRLLRVGARAAYRAAFKHPNCTVIFENPDDMSTFLEDGLVPPAGAALIRGVGVDVDRFRPVERVRVRPTIVLPARMLRDKGVTEFVEAARLLARRGVEASFALVGDTDPGNPAAIPREQLQRWAADGDVEWWGWQDDMVDVYRRSDVVCLPSYREGLPTALVEAGACGLPVIATDVPGCREIVRHQVTGLLVPVRDPVALADAITLLVQDPTLRWRLGAAARAHVVRHYSAEHVLAQTLAVYGRRLPGLAGIADGAVVHGTP
jgi:UDP-N-acetylmuramyl pentapeptide phosphotransferase/UDP-N-acetylglucosamine-1-phosphate transferase/glycosyltransferase involved in cell wall biosynthesis